MTLERFRLASLLPGSIARGPSSPEEVESLLEQMVRDARARWHEVALDPVDFVRFVGKRLPGDVPLPLALETTATDELYLALGCLRGDPAALRAFDVGYLGEVGAFVCRINPTPVFADEVRQMLRERLLAADGAGGEPKIAEYSGAGALGGWIRVSALRIALDLERSARRAGASTQTPVEAALGADPGPELAFLKAHYRGAFTEALRAAVAELSERERALLRLYHVEALSLEAMAALYRVHLSTISRWLSRARHQIAEVTTARLCRQLGVGASAADSIAALVLSQVDLSLSGLLGPAG